MALNKIKPCPHNAHVDCDKQCDCNKCGWFREENARRNALIDAMDFSCQGDGVIGLVIKKEDAPVGNSDLQSDE